MGIISLISLGIVVLTDKGACISESLGSETDIETDILTSAASEVGKGTDILTFAASKTDKGELLPMLFRSRDLLLLRGFISLWTAFEHLLHTLRGATSSVVMPFSFLMALISSTVLRSLA